MLLGTIVGAGATPPDYSTTIKPLLRERCFACHGALKQRAGLRLDTLAAMRSGGDSGSVVVPGKAAESPLWKRIVDEDPSERMPPQHEGERLTEDETSRIRAWIEAGADGPPDEVPEADPREHWAFRTPSLPEVPRDVGDGWARNPVDVFVASKHREHGLAPVPEAERGVLIRRLHVDLIGLPPTADDWHVLDADTGAGWYERLVDRLLDDPRHGERWARHWMDIWRYSDWWGLGDQLRNSQKHIWRWRDWIVDSLNEDVAYDEMLRLMLAADELHPDDLGKLRATGFLARNYFLFNRNQWMDETVEHVGKGILGLTLNCAKCHDHKYDPFGHAEYYRFRAFFEPYHARLEVVPGEPDLARDGVPRVFDGKIVPPTYRFQRGQESQPDKTVVIQPGVPELLAFRELVIRPVPLPATAREPERRPWVFEAHRNAARIRLETARKGLAEALSRLADARSKASDAGALAAAESARDVAEADDALARAEAESLEWRIAATRARWASDEGVEPLPAPPAEASPVGREKVEELGKQAVRSERDVAVARTRRIVAETRGRWREAKDESRKAIQTNLDRALEALDKALTEAAKPVGAGTTFAPVIGAAWTPTRFFDSTKDDPIVESGRESTGRRKALAEWISDRRNPLTARVAVNHVWNRHFGAPLVPSVFEFGRKGIPPPNQALLDWLACDWMEHGWSFKHLHRRIVLSTTYRMTSALRGDEPSARKDPDNRHLWRRSPVRIEAQVVRDSILAHAGTLDASRGGPPVPPAEQAGSTRRSLYFYHSNNDRNLFLSTFDDATVKECYRRDESVVPQQALALAHGGLIHDGAGRIAARLGSVPGSGSGAGADRSDRSFARRCFRVLLGYEPGERELAAALGALGRWKDVAGAGGGNSGPRSDPSAWLVWALLNHDDFVTLR